MQRPPRLSLGSTLCAQQAKLSKLAAGVDELAAVVCKKGHLEDEEVSAVLEPLHDEYYARILALPPR